VAEVKWLDQHWATVLPKVFRSNGANNHSLMLRDSQTAGGLFAKSGSTRPAFDARSKWQSRQSKQRVGINLTEMCLMGVLCRCRIRAFSKIQF